MRQQSNRVDTVIILREYPCSTLHLGGTRTLLVVFRRARRSHIARSSLLLAGDKILIAAGAKAKLADIPGMELPGVVTSEELLVSKAHKYENMLILGGGVIGLELATVFQALGTNVMTERTKKSRWM